MTGPIVIAGGGTGGHVFVADAVARSLVDRGTEKDQLRFVGSERGQERQLLADSGITLILLPGRGIRRSLRPSACVANLVAVGGIARAVVRSIRLIRRLRPAAVVSVGGYAAAPVALAAVLLHRPLVLVNVDAVPGLTHRIFGRYAVAACVAFPGTPLDRATVTGAPVRPEFAAIEGDEAARRLAVTELGMNADRPIVAVLTGSLGARSVNEAVLGLAERWRNKEVTIVHVTGRRDFNDLVARWTPQSGDNLDYRQVPFEARVPLLYQAAQVAITRAGALTVAELAMAGLPAILVPLPGAPGDHQTLNARVLERAGAGVIVPDADLSAAALEETLNRLLDDAPGRAQMARHARSLGHADAAAAVAEVVLSHVR